MGFEPKNLHSGFLYVDHSNVSMFSFFLSFNVAIDQDKGFFEPCCLYKPLKDNANLYFL